MSEHIILAPYYSKDHEKARKSTLRSKFGEEKKTIEEFHFPSSFIGELPLGFPKKYHMPSLASRSKSSRVIHFNKKKRKTKKRGIQHEDFPGGHPS